MFGGVRAGFVATVVLVFALGVAPAAADPKLPKGGRTPAKSGVPTTPPDAARLPTALEKAISESKSKSSGTGAVEKAPEVAPRKSPPTPDPLPPRATQPVTPPALPSVRAASPNEVKLIVGSRTTVSVKLAGTGLDRLRDAAVREGERPAQGVSAKLRPGGAARAVLELSVAPTAKARDGLTVHLVGGAHRVEVPLRLSVEAAPPPTTPPSLGGARDGAGDAIGVNPPSRISPPGPTVPPTAPPTVGRDVGPRTGRDGPGGRARPQTLLGLIVRVEDEDGGAPVTGAHVCLGRPGLPVAYGMQRTDARGDARFPNAPPGVGLQAIVAREGYEGRIEDVDYDLPEENDLEDCPPSFVIDGDFDPDGGDDCEPFDRDTVEIERGEGGPTCPPEETGTLRVATAAGAAVCLGGPSGPSQFGARQADASGAAEFEDLPLATPLRLLIDLAGYERVEESLILRDDDVTERTHVLSAGESGGQISLENGACVQRVHAGPVAPPPAFVREEPEPEPAAPERVRYGPIHASELVVAANERGYSTLVRSDSNDVDCRLRSGNLVIEGRNRSFYTVPPVCRYLLLVGPDLHPEWAVVSVRLDSTTDVRINERWSEDFGGNPGFEVQMVMPRSEVHEASWAVTFQGPPGRDWREALTRP